MSRSHFYRNKSACTALNARLGSDTTHESPYWEVTIKRCNRIHHYHQFWSCCWKVRHGWRCCENWNGDWVLLAVIKKSILTELVPFLISRFTSWITVACRMALYGNRRECLVPLTRVRMRWRTAFHNYFCRLLHRLGLIIVDLSCASVTTLKGTCRASLACFSFSPSSQLFL